LRGGWRGNGLPGNGESNAPTQHARPVREDAPLKDVVTGRQWGRGDRYRGCLPGLQLAERFGFAVVFFDEYLVELYRLGELQDKG
jgi:hypothetical protein